MMFNWPFGCADTLFICAIMVFCLVNVMFSFGSTVFAFTHLKNQAYKCIEQTREMRDQVQVVYVRHYLVSSGLHTTLRNEWY